MEKGIILNGSNSIAVAKENDLIHRLKPTPQYTAINFGVLLENMARVYDLSKYLTSSYRVLSNVWNYATDNKTDWKENPTASSPYVNSVTVKVFEGDNCVCNRFLYTQEAYWNDSYLILHPHQKVQLTSDTFVTNLTFYCEKVILEQPINLVPELIYDKPYVNT